MKVEHEDKTCTETSLHQKTDPASMHASWVYNVFYRISPLARLFIFKVEIEPWMLVSGDHLDVNTQNIEAETRGYWAPALSATPLPPRHTCAPALSATPLPPRHTCVQRHLFFHTHVPWHKVHTNNQTTTGTIDGQKGGTSLNIKISR